MTQRQRLWFPRESLHPPRAYCERHYAPIPLWEAAIAWIVLNLLAIGDVLSFAVLEPLDGYWWTKAVTRQPWRPPLWWEIRYAVYCPRWRED